MRKLSLGIVLALQALAQNPESVSGVVRDSLTGEPVRDALVYMRMEPRGNRPEHAAEELRDQAAVSDSGGEFRFDGLSAGHYTFRARKPGFEQPDSSTCVIPRAPADGPVVIDLTPLGSIEGTLLNQYDEPIEEVLVLVWESRTRDGELAPIEVGRLWTDYRGQFRLTRVLPGKYYVKAMGRRGGTEVHVGKDDCAYAPWEGFTPVYFGGATEIEQALPVLIAAGTRTRADFRLDVQRAFKIRGRLENYEAPEAASFELMGTDELVEPSRAILDGTTGRFEVLDVVPGVYRLRATQGKRRGEVVVNVKDEDVDDVSIALLPGAVIKGLVHTVAPEMDAASGPVEYAGRAPRARGGCYCAAVLYERGRLDAEPVRSQAATELRAEEAEFTVADVWPGKYRAAIQCPGGYPRTATFGTADFLTDATIDISPGASQPAIDITCVAGGGTLKVQVGGQLSPPIGVLAVPAFAASTGPFMMLCPYPHQAATPRQCMADHIAPGDYSVYGLSLSRSDDARFRDPEFLRSLPQGATVHIDDGKTTDLTLASVLK